MVWGNKNLRWGSPSYLLEPGDPGYVELRPGDPGYVPPAPPKPEPKRKPRRRSTLSAAENPEPSHTAMSLEYVIVPNPKNPLRPFRARVNLGDQLSQADFLSRVVADSQEDAATVEKVIRSVLKVTVASMRTGNQLASIFDLFRAQPTISGSFTTNNPSAEEVKAGVAFSLIVGPDALAAMLDGLTVEKVDETGAVKPEVENVTLSPGGTPNVYSLTAGLRCTGDHFRGSGSGQAWPGAYLLDEDLSNPIPLTVISCSQTELLIAPPPAGTTGIKRLKLVAGWNADIEFLYPIPLTLAT